ncbi:O-antigen ligase family protein [Streptomyces mirabilis]|uniref:O-antigen ligase family protein n=1 Tax=Streptomyces mirabilis TaxID=68239 RepID=UPI00225A8914|nr:O-antigen ligase family protein [Streptomyces mirabilis]MCX5349368.1 O-antigen ligase family protein [Streptomyces mirabilis]
MIEKFSMLAKGSDVSMPGHTAGLLLFAFAMVCAAAVLFLAMRISAAAWVLWCACLVPLFLFGREYAMVGVSPVYLMDFFAVMALLATVGTWGPRTLSEERLRGFRRVAILLAAIMAQAVYRGVAAEYPDPLKGAIMGVYPIFGWLAATWLLTLTNKEIIRWRWVLYAPTLGLFLKMALDTSMAPAATGIYLVIAGAFGVQRHNLGHSRLLIWTLVGAAVLTALASKRGPLLAVVATIVAAAVASRATRRHVARRPAVPLVLAMAGVIAALAFTLSGQQLTEAPVVGGLATRLESSAGDSNSESANNVELRFAMWQEALRTAGENPLFGAGAGHPMELVFKGHPLNDPKSGPHNSFVGYVFYLGWPAGIAVCLLICAILRRTWRARHHPVGASWFGATVGVCITACTNVAFETTFIGLPSWLVLSCAYALVGVPRGQEAAELRDRGFIARQRPARAPGPVTAGRILADPTVVNGRTGVGRTFLPEAENSAH